MLALINVALVAMPALHGLEQLVAAGKTSRITARCSPADRAALHQLASKRGMTLSNLVLSALAATTPTRDQVAALKAVTAALGLPADSDAETITSALAALLEATAPSEPSNTDALQAAPDAQPPAQLLRSFTTSRGAVTLSASEIESCKEMGAKLEAYAENKAIRDAARRSAQARRR